jgi:hypothetical protein
VLAERRPVKRTPAQSAQRAFGQPGGLSLPIQINPEYHTGLVLIILQKKLVDADSRYLPVLSTAPE